MKYLGGIHGFAGNVLALLKALPFLSAAQREFVLKRSEKTVRKLARRETGFANWPPSFTEKKMMVQWCHGAPGFITSYGDFPTGYSSDLDQVLLEAGELVWAVGPGLGAPLTSVSLEPTVLLFLAVFFLGFQAALFGTEGGFGGFSPLWRHGDRLNHLTKLLHAVGGVAALIAMAFAHQNKIAFFREFRAEPAKEPLFDRLRKRGARAGIPAKYRLRTHFIHVLAASS